MPKPQPHIDPIQEAVSTWLAAIKAPESKEAAAWRQCLCDDAPKRFTIYEPMALLPAGNFSNPAWADELRRHSTATVDSLWELILQSLSKTGKAASILTHLAVNEGIPAERKDGAGENVIRSPSGLRILYGNFGPETPRGSPPLEGDFGQAFWVSTKQNGIYQTWAPRWTMFSRGNVKEKARLLQFPAASKAGQGDDGPSQESWAVDMYAGIGYFTFCYAKLGMRVVCWELNPWSVEALRRGAHLNKWSVEVVDGDRLAQPTAAIMKSTARIVVFSESNEHARWRTEEMKKHGLLRDVRHVNCGLLPTSRLTWEASLFLTRTTTVDGLEAWLHLHENVGAADIDARREEIQALLRDSQEEQGLGREIMVDKVEKVKTYAPGVWHCVFDVRIITKP